VSLAGRHTQRLLRLAPRNTFQTERKKTRGCFASFARRSLQATASMGRLEFFSIFEKLGKRAANIALRVSCELTAFGPFVASTAPCRQAFSFNPELPAATVHGLQSKYRLGSLT